MSETLKLRELRGDDLYSLLAIVGKLNIKDEFVKIFESNVDEAKVVALEDRKDKKPTKKQQEEIDKAKVKAEADLEKRGMQAGAALLQKVLFNIKLIKPEINELLADLTGTTEKEISALGLKEYTSLIIAFFKKPELADFFSSIASLLN